LSRAKIETRSAGRVYLGALNQELYRRGFGIEIDFEIDIGRRS
jgi:hypothetical protein